jgi:hypothetical protein
MLLGPSDGAELYSPGTKSAPSTDPRIHFILSSGLWKQRQPSKLITFITKTK